MSDDTSNRYLNLNEFESVDNTNQDIYNINLIEKAPIEQQAANEHSFNIRFFHKPVLCFHCIDYIWGSGYIGYGCKQCAKCVHFKCLIFVAKQLTCSPNPQENLLDTITKLNIYPIENWTNDLVKEWLAVVNLHRYAEVFSKYNITGSRLISLSSDQLYEYRIRDSFHHKAIIECCQELIYKSRQYSTYSQMLKEMNEFRTSLNKTPFKASRHFFLIHTLSTQDCCNKCQRPFLGIIHQALLCQQCGLMIHRQCSSIGLPDCKQKNIQSNKHYLFGVSLFDLCNSSDSNQVPLILTKSFKYIEDRALITNEDLYDAYRLSSDTTKIEPIKQQLNENGIELTRFERYDLNTIAAIVKSFLRDLQNSVIPEEIYDKLINNIQTINTKDLRELIKTSLHPQHLACLSYIMAHLIRVWNYQYKTRGCHYLPDKIFHIFRSILMRPPWEKIVQIVYNIDKQTLVIQRLMLECDWGVELPEFKLKADRSSSEPIAMNANHSLVHSVNSLFFLANKLIPASNKTIKSNLPSIDSQEWYWNNIVNRDNTALILKNCPDGSFIVRNSSDKNPSIPYTLCVMKGTFVKSIKIFYSDQLYDIEKPCRFETVQSLIDYYSRVSLKEYNHNLDLKLTYGVSKFKFGRTSEWSIDKLYASFREALDKYESLTKMFLSLESDISIIREDLTNKRLACEAFDKIIEMYENQKDQAVSALTSLQLKKSNAISATTMLATQFMPVKGNDTQNTEKIERIMLNNKLKLEQKTVELRGKKEQVLNDMEYLNVNLSELQEKLDSLRPEIIELRKKRENYHMWLLQRGENEDKIQTVIEPARAQLTQNQSQDGLLDNYDPISRQKSELNTDSTYSRIKPSVSMGDLNSIKESNILNQPDDLTNNTTYFVLENKNEETYSFMDSLNWFRADFTRDKAEEVLKDRPNGTFLVRSSQFPGSKYVLSLMFNQIIHILIDEFQNKYFLKSNNQRRMKYTLSNSSISSGSSTRSRSPSSSDQILTSKSSTNSLSLANDENANSIMKFDTLTDLIIYYSKNELRIGTQSWNTVLSWPAFYNSAY